MELGDRLRLLRERQGLTQLALANKLHLPNQNISNYERGFRQPDYETLQLLADFFDVTIDYLITGQEDKRTCTVSVADQVVELTVNEYKLLLEMKKHPEFEALLHELSKEPERNINRLIRMWAFIKSELEMDQREEG
ncbi:helix-turn-helix domain-containing protein [Numidum massiliense]|uniref:helix-turn-helix domain-containing protein n=1 Tax=Numidum massiliense TaxID=1522315 RepID=UPI0006D59FC5|nr:helix-turn-helix transcriptional regulator [Numidum massiliense]